MSSQRSGSCKRRRLGVERLSQRLLMAGDMTNPVNPLDVNNDDTVTAGDALVVINYMSQQRLQAEGEAAGSSSEMFPDTNGDLRVTAADALMVINNIGEGEHLDGNGLANNVSGIVGLHFSGRSSVNIDFVANNAFVTVTTSSPGHLTFSAGGQSETVSIRNSLRIDASGAGNRLVFNGAVIPDDLIIDVSGHNNAVQLINTFVGDDFIYYGGSGSDGVVLDTGTTIGDDAVIKVRKGNDTIVVQGARVADDVLIYGDDGDDVLAVDGVNIGDDAIVRLGDHNDTASFANAAVRDVADIEGDRGFDTLAVDVNSVSARRFRPDEFEANGSLLNTQVLIDQLFGTDIDFPFI